METEARSDTSANAYAIAASMRRAGFWIRLLAGFVDLFILVVPFCIFVSFDAAAMGISNPFFNNRIGRPLNETLRQYGPAFLFVCVGFFALEGLVYFAVSESSSWHATLGKRLLGLYVTNAAGKPLDFWQACLRFCTGRLLMHVPVVGSYYFLLDCLCIGLLPGKQAVHDRVSGCQVLQESARGAEFR